VTPRLFVLVGALACRADRARNSEKESGLDDSGSTDPLRAVAVAWLATTDVQRIVSVGPPGGATSQVAVCERVAGSRCRWSVYKRGEATDQADLVATIGDPDGFGPWIAGGRDLSGDGEPDLVLSKATTCADEQPAEPIYVFFGPLHGSLLTADADVTIAPDPHDQNFGTLVPWLGDLDRDGAADLLVGSGCSPLRFRGWRGPIGAETTVAKANLTITPAAPDSTPFWVLPGVIENVDASAGTAIVMDVGWTFLGSFAGWSKPLPLFQITWKSGYAQGNDYFLSLAEPADVDGDGATDVIIHTDATTHPHTAVWTTTIWGAGIGSQQYCVPDTSLPSRFLLFPADVNGDGQTDLVESALDTYLGPVTGFGTCAAPLAPSIPTPVPDRRATLNGGEIAAVDWDGDGRDEIVASFGSEGVAVLRIGQD
jgi:hypothetical protein